MLKLSRIGRNSSVCILAQTFCEFCQKNQQDFLQIMQIGIILRTLNGYHKGFVSCDFENVLPQGLFLYRRYIGINCKCPVIERRFPPRKSCI